MKSSLAHLAVAVVLFGSLQGGLQSHVGGLGGARHDNRRVGGHVAHVEHPLGHDAMDAPVAIHHLHHKKPRIWSQTGTVHALNLVTHQASHQIAELGIELPAFIPRLVSGVSSLRADCNVGQFRSFCFVSFERRCA